MNIANVETEALGFWSKHKKTLVLILAALLLLFVGFVSGRYTGTPKTVEKEKIVTKTQEKIVYQDRIVEKKVYVQVEKKHEHVDTIETKKPDGTVVTETKKDTDTNTGINETTNTDSTHTMTETKYVDRIVEKEKLVLKQPDWRVTVGGGISVPYYIGQGSLGVPGMQGWVVQVGADRRVLGPLWFGIAGNTQGTLLVNLSAVW